MCKWNWRNSSLTILLSLSLCFSSSFSFGDTSAPDWQSLALSACEREGCDGRLLVAIGTYEPDKRGSETVGDDGLSFGRFQIQVLTASCHIPLGPKGAIYCRKARELSADQYARIIDLLRNDLTAASLAAKELARCSRHNKRTRSRLKCWNKGAGYPDRVMPIYLKTKGRG
jgi:hypothetical protein